MCSPTRGVFEGGDSGSTTNVIDFITIASAGNATDFGDTTAARETSGGGSSSVRGIFMGGYTSGDTNAIEFITIASAGNSTDFGDLTAAEEMVEVYLTL